MTLGPIFIDLPGTSIERRDQSRLTHPDVGGVVLFSRNYTNNSQLKQLVSAIHQVRSPPLLVSVDHEGGRVQRFVSGFTRLPSARALGLLFDSHPRLAVKVAYAVGYVTGAELSEAGIDLVLAPVIDLFRADGSAAIGDRAYHEDPTIVVELALSVMQGIHDGGGTPIPKHFPGHGSVQLDSHLDLPANERVLESILATDLKALRAARRCTMLCLDDLPRVFSIGGPRPRDLFKSVVAPDLKRALGFPWPFVQ